jgi:hypothetical protein
MTKNVTYSNSRDCYKNSPFYSIKHSSYFAVYDVLFSKYRGSRITFVEIGVLEGGSLFMWREFFGPQARIIGVDFNPNAKKWEEHGFEIFIGSQSSPEFWEIFFDNVGNIDIILDDGGHTYVQQIITTEMSLDYINDGGLLVIEDTHTSYMPGFGNKNISFINYCKLWVDKINSRFGRFSPEQADKRVWSLEFFESFAAFKVNRAYSHQKSFPTENGGIRDYAMDFRNKDQGYIKENLPRIKDVIERALKLFA